MPTMSAASSRRTNFDALARKTIITDRDVVDCLMNTPHRPHLKLDASRRSSKFIVHQIIRRYYPVAPGMVLIKAPGHSPDMQMVYIRLQSGREYLHSDRYRLDTWTTSAR